jgi:hypothetical protein
MLSGIYSTLSVRPVGTSSQAGPLPLESHIDISAKEEGKTPVELAVTAPDVGEHVVGRIDEAVEVAYLK